MIKLNEGYREILDAIASDSPTPGGGSVAALSLAHAHALACMVARLTLKSDKWESGHDAAAKILDVSQEGVSAAIDLAHKDAKSFDSVMRAFKMPKITDPEIARRRYAITHGYGLATAVPIRTAHLGLKLLRSLEEFVTTCNANAITDLAAAAELAHSMISIAALNVKINLPSLEEPMSSDYLKGIGLIESESAVLVERINTIVAGRM